MDKIRIKLIEFKIISLISNLKSEQKTAIFLAGKLNLSKKTVKNHLELLTAKDILKESKDAYGVKRYFMVKKYEKPLYEAFEVEWHPPW